MDEKNGYVNKVRKNNNQKISFIFTSSWYIYQKLSQKLVQGGI